MKHIALILTAFFMLNIFSAQAQDEKMSQKERKKMEKNSEMEKNYVETGNLLDSMQFVLEAYYLDNQRGNRVIVPNALNFIKVDSSDAVLQIGRNSGMGSNGVGGVTAEGRVVRYDVTKNDKKKTFNVRMNVNTNLGNYDVIMFVSANGNARATISGTTPGKLTYEGDLVSLADSRTFQGRTMY